MVSSSTAASSIESLPKMFGIEIAFAGRSNVGKSSLINALTGRKTLVRVSHTPGRTQELVFFTGDPVLRVVDMPGYGYAAAPKSKVAAWTELVHAYLRGRANLMRVYVLIDARHGLKDTDNPSLDVLGEAAVSHQIVLTKADQVKPAELEARIGEVEAPWPSGRPPSRRCWPPPRAPARACRTCVPPSRGSRPSGAAKSTGRSLVGPLAGPRVAGGRRASASIVGGAADRVERARAMSGTR